MSEDSDDKPFALESDAGGKVCRKCRKRKPFDDFWAKWKSGRKQRQSYCKKCHSTLNGDWLKKNPEKAKAIIINQRPKHRARRLKREYGISQEEYDGIIKRQNGLCPICGMNVTDPPVRRPGKIPHVD